jgi:hypothetical protein
MSILNKYNNIFLSKLNNSIDNKIKKVIDNNNNNNKLYNYIENNELNQTKINRDILHKKYNIASDKKSAISLGIDDSKINFKKSILFLEEKFKKNICSNLLTKKNKIKINNKEKLDLNIRNQRFSQKTFEIGKEQNNDEKLDLILNKLNYLTNIVIDLQNKINIQSQRFSEKTTIINNSKTCFSNKYIDKKIEKYTIDIDWYYYYKPYINDVINNNSDNWYYYYNNLITFIRTYRKFPTYNKKSKINEKNIYNWYKIQKNNLNNWRLFKNITENESKSCISKKKLIKKLIKLEKIL